MKTIKQKQVEAAIKHVNAIAAPGGYIFFHRGSQATWKASSHAMAKLGKDILSGKKDAFQYWFAEAELKMVRGPKIV